MKNAIFINNIQYMMKNWMNWDKKSLAFFIVRIPALVFQPIVTAYIPKAMIDCINNGVTLDYLATIIALLSVLVALTAWLSPFMQELLLGSARIIRMRYAVLAFKKNIYMDYINVESFEGREKNKRASEFYRSNYSSSSEFIENSNQFFVCLVGVLISAVLIYKINFLMILIIFLTCVGEFFLLKYLNTKEKSVKDIRSNILVKLDYFYKLSKETSYSKDIKSYNFSDYFIYILSKFIFQLEKITSKYIRQSFKVSGTRAILNLIRELIAYIYLIFLVVQSRLSISDFVFYFGIITGFSNWIMNLVVCYSNIERNCNDCQAFRDFINQDDEYDFVKGNHRLLDIKTIEFRNVSFKYPNADDYTIKNISFKINSEENIAIVGENGSGKTTIVKLLCGLYKPTSGNILINGIDINDISIPEYFDLFSPVFQDYSFLPMSIAENVSVSLDYDESRLQEALIKAGIKSKIESLPKKEKTLMIKDVYKNAVEFSGGEKQKLLLAKAIYKNASILILDEPTAALDPIAENELYLKYNEITKNKISFFISHRLSSTRFCDRILFVKEGKILEEGSHSDLMQLRRSYYKMYQVQSYYYKEVNN